MDAGASPDEGCGLSDDERAVLATIERSLSVADPGFALRLSRVRGHRVRAWLLTPGGSAAGAATVAVGAVGSVWSAWFAVLLCVGSVPAIADVAETRRLVRTRGVDRRRTARIDRSSEWT